VISFLINRATRHWQVLSILILGVLISTAFLTSGPLIVDTVMNFAIPHKIRSTLEQNGTIYLSTYNKNGEGTYWELNKGITNILTENVSEIFDVVHTIKTP